MANLPPARLGYQAPVFSTMSEWTTLVLFSYDADGELKNVMELFLLA